MTNQTAPQVPCVGGVVLQGGRFLLVRRGQEPSLGLWSVPGGRLEPGETPEEGCAREVLEETGVRVEVGRLVGTVERDAPSGGVYVIDDFLCAPLPPYDRPVAGDDADDARWFTRAELETLDAEGHLAPGVLDALRTWHLLL